MTYAIAQVDYMRDAIKVGILTHARLLPCLALPLLLAARDARDACDADAI
jgi:hypothetical protein